jgi:hypothetical protein
VPFLWPNGVRGVPLDRGSLFYLLRNRYVGEVKYKDEILPGETAGGDGSRAI